MEVTGQIKTRSFKDDIKNSSAESDEVFCHPCGTDDDWVVAVGYCQNCSEYFCAACLKTHRKQSMSRHHVILEGEDMPRSQISKIQLDPCSDPCAQHPNEIVKFYCSLHDNVGCGDCMVLSHKTCKVDRIQDISSTYFSSAEHRDLVRSMDKFLKDLDKLNDQVQTNERKINEQYSKIINAIQSFRKEVNGYLDKREADILAEAEKRKEMDEEIMSKLEIERRLLQDEIKEIEKKLNQQSSKANELFVTAKGVKKRMSSLEATLKEMLQNSQIKEHRFEQSPEIHDVLVSQVPLGKLTENFGQAKPQKVARFEDEIDARMQGDKSNCFLIASAIISSTEVVLADYNNRCVKLVDTGQRKILARYVLNTVPTDVARVSETKVAVALPNTHTLLFLSISKQRTFTEERKVKMIGECLYCEQDKIVIACEGKIEILNKNGKLVHSIPFQDLTLPRCIVPADDCKSFFVANSAWEGKPACVYKLNYDGSLAATYRDQKLASVGEITLTKEGSLFVCNWSDPGSIDVVSPECKKIAEIVQQNEHVRRPRCVSYCEETNKLFVCNNIGRGSNDKLNDILKIFQIY